MRLFDVYPLFDINIVKGNACHVWDDKGQEYLDLYGGHAVISIGHSHPHYVEMISKQVAMLGFYSNSVINKLQQEVADRLGAMCGYDDYQLFLINSGAEANENALKLASFYNGRTRIVSFGKAFHGRTSLAVEVTDNPKIIAPVNANQHVTYLPRSGKFFAHQYSGIRPDIITVAKGIGNGFPMGGVLISPKFKPVYGQLGTTFGGNHLACAAAIAVLDVIKEEKLIENAAKVGTHLLEELKCFKGIKEVRGCGLMIGLEFEEPVKELRTKLLFEQKVFTGVSGTNVIRLLPPLCLSMNEADEFLTRLQNAMRTIG